MVKRKKASEDKRGIREKKITRKNFRKEVIGGKRRISGLPA